MDDNDYLFDERQTSAGYTDYEASVPVSMETHIPENNIGYKMLQKMGWHAGKGLGSQGQGSVRKHEALFVLTFVYTL